MSTKYAKWLQNRPNVHKIDQHLKMQHPPKITQIWIFGLKIYHLATLIANISSFVCFLECCKFLRSYFIALSAALIHLSFFDA
jgi:hypothetical protein